MNLRFLPLKLLKSFKKRTHEKIFKVFKNFENYRIYKPLHPKLSNVIDAINFILIITNLLSFFLYGLKLGNILVSALTAIFYYLTRCSIQETVLFILAYPLAWLFLLPIKNADLDEVFNIPIPSEINLKISEDIINVLPVKTVLLIGGISEKKKASRIIVTYVTKGVDVEKNMKFLRLLKKDPHIDVVLYATQAMEDIERYYEREIAKYVHSNTLYSCKLIYNFLKTHIPTGKIRKDFERILLEKLERVSDKVPLYYEIKYYLTSDLECLLKGYKETKSPYLLRTYILEKLRMREYKEIKELLTPSVKSLIFEFDSL